MSIPSPQPGHSRARHRDGSTPGGGRGAQPAAAPRNAASCDRPSTRATQPDACTTWNLSGGSARVAPFLSK
jgi:hypothetical protein